MLMAVAVATLVISAVGFGISLLVNVFFMDRYDAYGSVPIPGSTSLRLPAGEVTITFGARTMSAPSGSGMPIPDLKMDLVPPSGVSDPRVSESIGSTITVNNDTRRRVWVAQIAEEGIYRVTTDGRVSAFIDPRLSFGHGGSLGWLPWVFAALFGLGVLDLIIAIVLRVRSKPTPALEERWPPDPGTGAGSPDPGVASGPAESSQAYAPTDAGIRVEALKDLAGLRDSGALTQEEFEAEKRRVLKGR